MNDCRNCQHSGVDADFDCVWCNLTSTGERWTTKTACPDWVQWVPENHTMRPEQPVTDAEFVEFMRPPNEADIPIEDVSFFLPETTAE